MIYADKESSKWIKSYKRKLYRNQQIYIHKYVYHEKLYFQANEMLIHENQGNFQIIFRISFSIETKIDHVDLSIFILYEEHIIDFCHCNNSGQQISLLSISSYCKFENHRLRLDYTSNFWFIGGIMLVVTSYGNK